ncbi:MAG: Hsp70 family protein [Lachnospiraceae bacterium]|jgi:molecular chaperone HscC|uniref:Hsp70 family protein n=1 Tax=Eubacterium ramulus TaxID=39490 RepID=UPI000D65223F|nr:Hsp70 family protein [Eubacterium ramulus]MBS5190291.1 Hsp70 family protein [Lachnospiraceae bacterium]
MAILGIDLGTTNSLGAVYRNGKVELIPNRFGSFLTPSVVSVTEDGSVVTGQIAKERLITHPKDTAFSFKKNMGSDQKYNLGGKTFLPEELSGFLVSAIVEDAKEYMGEEIKDVIISVPAYFHDKQRVATKRAGALAGVNVKRIVNEPSAAALASYFDTQNEQLFLVFDFGGGTLDVSIVDCFDTMVDILAVSGDNHLGGDDFNEAVAEGFLREHQLQRGNLSEKEYAILLRQAEKCKIALSTEKEVKMTAVLGGQTYQSVYTNERMMRESSAVWKRIQTVLRRALRDSRVEVEDIDAVILAGGSGKMPLVQSYMEQLFDQTPLVTGFSDQLIARGLGLVCGVMERKDEVRDYILTDICPFTLGTGVNNEADPKHPYMSAIIERNSILPCSKIRGFSTAADYQSEVKIEILQGEEPYAEDNVQLGVVTVAVPKKKKGMESVDVRFTYDINGILEVEVTVVSTGKSVKKVLSQNMDEKEIAKRMKQLEKLKVHPKDMTENQLILERLQALYEEALPETRDRLMYHIRNFESTLAEQDPRRIRKYREFLEHMIASLEHYDPFEGKLDFPEWSDDDDGET